MSSAFSALAHPGRFFKRLRRQARIRDMARGQSRRLVVGASGLVPPGWVGSEIEDLNLLQPQTWKKFFAEGSLDAILSEHVWEHLTPSDGLVAARTCFRFLKPGGYLRAAVPDGLHPDRQYLDWVRPGGSGAGAEDHKLLYTYATFSETLRGAGFEVRLLEYFDERGVFHFTDWDPESGMIRRSRRFDPRNEGGRLRFTSLIVDAFKAAGAAHDGLEKVTASPGMPAEPAGRAA